MLEQWSRWEPIKNLSSKYVIRGIKNNLDGLEFSFTEAYGKTKKIRIFFKDGVYAYRMTDESYWLNQFHNLNEKYGKGFYADWMFFRITQSEYLASLFPQGVEGLRPKTVIHYCLISYNFIFDIAASEVPFVECIL